jgi:FkbM family methyltransferase
VKFAQATTSRITTNSTRELPLTFRALEFYGVHLQHPGHWRVHEKLRKWLKADPKGSFEVQRQGFKWVLNPADFVEADLFWLGEKDHWDSFHIRRLVHPGAVVFDVGANFGYYSICVFENCRVFAFEPYPRTRARLQGNVDLNDCPQISIVPQGLSDSNITTRMAVRDDNSGSARIAGNPDGVEVFVCTMDSFCSARGIRTVDFIKVDVEGHEESVLRGGEETIRASRPAMMIELDPAQLRRSGSRVEDLIETLRGFGYKLMTAKRHELVPLNGIPTDGDVINAFCIP